MIISPLNGTIRSTFHYVFIISLLSLTLIIISLSTTPAQAENMVICGGDKTSFANVRTGPSAKKYPLLKKLYNGHKVRVFSRITNDSGYDYFRIQFKDENGRIDDGFVYHELVRSNCDIPTQKSTLDVIESSVTEDSFGIHFVKSIENIHARYLKSKGEYEYKSKDEVFSTQYGDRCIRNSYAANSCTEFQYIYNHNSLLIISYGKEGYYGTYICAFNNNKSQIIDSIYASTGYGNYIFYIRFPCALRTESLSLIQQNMEYYINISLENAQRRNPRTYNLLVYQSDDSTEALKISQKALRLFDIIIAEYDGLNQNNIRNNTKLQRERFISGVLEKVTIPPDQRGVFGKFLGAVGEAVCKNDSCNSLPTENWKGGKNWRIIREDSVFTYFKCRYYDVEHTIGKKKSCSSNPYFVGSIITISGSCDFPTIEAAAESECSWAD